MKTNKSILRKISEWEGDPMLVAGMYRLFVYLPWDLIPDKYKEFFKEDAKDNWDNDLEAKANEKSIYQDIESEIRTILQELPKKNIINCLGIIPMLLADAFIIGHNVGTIQGKLFSIINRYKSNITIDIGLAEGLAIHEVLELLKEIESKFKLKLSFDLDKASEQVLDAVNKVQKDIVSAKGKLGKDIDKAVDEALRKEKEQKNEE